MPNLVLESKENDIVSDNYNSIKIQLKCLKLNCVKQ